MTPPCITGVGIPGGRPDLAIKKGSAHFGRIYSAVLVGFIWPPRRQFGRPISYRRSSPHRPFQPPACTDHSAVTSGRSSCSTRPAATSRSCAVGASPFDTRHPPLPFVLQASGPHSAAGLGRRSGTLRTCLLPMSCHRGRHDRARRPAAGRRIRGPLFLGPDPRRRRQTPAVSVVGPVPDSGLCGADLSCHE